MKVFLWKGSWSDPIAASIRLWTFSPYTHSGLVHEDQVWEFTRWGFNLEPLKSYPGDWEVWEYLDLTRKKESLMRDKMIKISNKGGRYDFSALAGLASNPPLAMASRYFGGPCHDKVNPFQHPNRYFCSEFVAEVSEAAGYFHSRNPSLVYPKDHAEVPWLRRIL